MEQDCAYATHCDENMPKGREWERVAVKESEAAARFFGKLVK